MPDAFAQLEDLDIDSRIVLDYTSRDFTSIRSQLIGLARGLMPEWETAGEPSDMGTLLMEIFAYMGDVMHFYIDRASSEAFLGSAIRQSSVLYIANMLGYTPIGQQSASVTLQFKLDPNATEDVIIPVGTRVHNAASNADDLIVFETDTEIKLPYTDAAGARWWETTGYATEGIVQHDRLLGVSAGAPNTEFLIPDKGVVHGSVTVVSREGAQTVEWAYISDISLARPTQPLFTIFRDEQDYTHIVFGDNASGRIPPVNAEIFVTYRYGVGAEANLLAPGAINAVVNNSGEDWWGITVTNLNSPVGGTDPESIDAMRQSIPRAAGRIKNRAITLHDYADMALQVPGVAKSVAHGTVYTAVRVKIAPTAGQGNDTYLQRLCLQVEEYMADKVIIGSTVYAEPDTMAELWQDVYIQALVHVQKGYNRTSVRSAVDATLRQVLSFDNVDFGTSVTIGQVYRAALAVQGVEWVELSWLSTRPPVDNTDPSLGDVVTILTGTWNHDSVLTMGADPGTGDYRRNNATSPTRFSFSTSAVPSTLLDDVKVGDHLVYRPVNDEQSWMSFAITGIPVVSATWVEMPVTLIDQSDTIVAPPVAAPVGFEWIRYAPTPDSTGGTIDIDTDELLIPRIAPAPTIKTVSLTNVALTGNVATLTTGSPHGIFPGETIDVVGAIPTLFNGRYVVTTSAFSTLTYAKVNAPVTGVASTGTVTTVNLPELEADYPGLTEEERIHDGLWVIADGGLLGT